MSSKMQHTISHRKSLKAYACKTLILSLLSVVCTLLLRQIKFGFSLIIGAIHFLINCRLFPQSSTPCQYDHPPTLSVSRHPSFSCLDCLPLISSDQASRSSRGGRGTHAAKVGITSKTDGRSAGVAHSSSMLPPSTSLWMRVCN
jgi:hypothetical protein